MTNLFSKINFHSGKLSTSEAQLLLDISLENQEYNLFEDILQVTYTNGAIAYTIDIGWYPEDFEISENSFFRVIVIVNENWSDALYDNKTKNLKELINLIEEAIELIMNQKT